MLGKEKFKTYGDVFDNHTWDTLHKLESQGHFDELIGSVSRGKEAHILLAKKKDGTKIILKVYAMMNCNFNKMFSYIRTDPRYENLKGRKRQVIFKWVQREFRNLLLAREAGVRVPTPYAFSNHIIVMEFIGDDEPAPQIKGSLIDDPKDFVKQIRAQMKLLAKAQLVHGDLSMFNILNFHQKPVFIDMSQSTSTKDPNSKEYLARDEANIKAFEKRVGIE